MARETLDARQAAEVLGVKLETLYAYVSRGLLKSLPGEGRARLYRRRDLERLRQRGSAAGVLAWGAPVLESGITQVTAEGPLYRGHSAVGLARDGVGFERVAELLWTGALPARARWAPTPAPPPVPAAPPLQRLAVLVPLLGLADPARCLREPEAVLPRARRVIRALSQALALPGREAQAARRRDVAGVLAAGLGARGGAAGRRALDQLLVLWADHELNVSAFAARVAASAQADLYGCLSAGLAALSGPLHGGCSLQVAALFEEVARPERAAEVVLARLARGDGVPGFAHPLYPQGDPRAVPLLDAARALGGARVEVADAVIEAVREHRSLAPTVDVGSVALTLALGIPAAHTPGLIAIGRAAGWVAHTLEQYAEGSLIRPRARYRDPRPGLA
ncbi:MAG: citrate synthase [Planctomycetota bacterium]